MTGPTVRRDIADREDIAAVVTDFYARAFKDDLLGPIFVDIAKMDLTAHLPVICDFWESVLLRAGRYHRNALRPHLDLHAKVGLAPAHFRRWLALWTSTIDERHAGEKAQLAKDQAARIAASISRRLSGPAAGKLIIGPSPTGRRQ